MDNRETVAWVAGPHLGLDRENRWRPVESEGKGEGDGDKEVYVDEEGTPLKGLNLHDGVQ